MRPRRFCAQQAVIALTVALVLAVTAGTALLLQSSYRQALGNAAGLLDSQARAAEIATSGRIAAVDAVLQEIGQATVRNLAHTRTISTASLMRRFHAGAHGIVDILILDGDGRRLNQPAMASDDAGEGNYAAADFFIVPRSSPVPGLYLGPPQRLPAAQGWSITFSRPLLRNGELVGVVAAVVRREYFVGPLRTVARDGMSRIALLRDDGSLIAGAPDHPGAVSQKPLFAAAALALLADRDTARLHGAADGRLRSLVRIAGRPLIVSASRGRSEVLRSWFDVCAAAVLGILAFAAAAVTLGWLAVRALGRRQVEAARLRRSEARLRRKSALLQSTLDHIEEGISVFSGRGRLLAWNSRFCELLELPPKMIAGESLGAILAQQARRGDFGNVSETTEVQRRLLAFYREVPTVRERTMRGGRMLQIRRRAMPGGAVVSVYSDISEIRASEHKLIEARRQAEFANRAKSEFLANMSHELRTPLNAIIGFSEMICGEIFGPIENSKYLEYLKDVHGSSLHLLSIINDVLDMSKIEAGKFELADDVVVLQRVIAEAIRMVGERARSRNIALVTAAPDREVRISGDERALKQIMLNLLSNAVKFSHDGNRIDVRLIQEPPGSVILEAEDYGIGIAEQDLDRVLQPFGQTRAVATKGYGGTGLGLPITKGLVAAHGGELVIHSKLGHGTLVRVILPTHPPLPTPGGERVLASREAAPATPAAA